jgi:hypothetical protein
MQASIQILGHFSGRDLVFRPSIQIFGRFSGRTGGGSCITLTKALFHVDEGVVSRETREKVFTF